MYNGSKSLLAQAIEREDWEMAALCVLLGAAEAASQLPDETLEALLDELDIEFGPQFGPPGRAGHRRSPGRRHRRRRGPA